MAKLIRTITRLIFFVILFCFWWAWFWVIQILTFKKHIRPKSQRSKENTSNAITDTVIKSDSNPLLSPSEMDWDREGAFNPAALYINDRVHLLYRAMGSDGVSRIGYASSPDGVNFDERLPYPIYTPQGPQEIANENQVDINHQKFDKNYRSGGGWCGCEDPRAVYIEEDKKIYLSYVAFAGWNSIRIAVTSIDVDDFLNKRWNWSRPVYLTEPQVIAKSGAFFPERIKGDLVFNYRVFHQNTNPPAPRTHFARIRNINPRTPVTNTNSNPYIQPEHNPEIKRWYSGKPSFGSPPIKTRLGWLVIQVAVAGRWEWPGSDMSCYRLGAIILDTNDLTKVLHQTNEAFIEPTQWYENDWKPGVVYCCGAVVKDEKLFIYYGSGDKHTSLATADFSEFIDAIETEMESGPESVVIKNNIKKHGNIRIT